VGRFLKVKRPNDTITYNPFQLIEIYRPATRSDDSGQVFYEFGETYPLYTSGGITYHTGGTQNQTATQPARFTFNDGDVYYKFREFYKDNLNPSTKFTLGTMDANYSDFWASSVNSNGRGFIIEPNTKQVRNPVLRRHGQTFQQNIGVNGLNRFYEADKDEFNRDYGDVMRMEVRDNSIIVFQKRKVGQMFVDRELTYNIDGQSNLILSSRLLSKIAYFRGEWGIGDNPESLGQNSRAFYGWDNNKGVLWRLSQDGLEDITRYGMSAFGKAEAKLRNATYKIYGVCDTDNDLYIFRFENAPGSSNKTYSWNEGKNGFESQLSYPFEMGACLNGLLVTFSSGKLWTHDSSTYCNFYGTQYDCYATAVFNDNVALKKNFHKVATLGSEGWDVPEITTNVYSYATTVQTTNIKAGAFVEKEGEYHAAIPKDANLVGGKINARGIMKGQFLKAKFRFQSASSFVFLTLALVGYSPSNKQPNK
jgi:hypothetical protein